MIKFSKSMDHIKEAFGKVKQDMDSLKYEFNILKKELIETRESMVEICEIIRELDKKPKEDVSTLRQINPTSSTHPSTHQQAFNPLKDHILPISTGNGGVSTDRQTDRQTDRHIQNKEKNKDFLDINNAVEILDSLDNIKKELRLKFKRLTEQELLVFSALYQKTEELGHASYKNLSEHLNLSESSIRDYIGRLIKKGIPVDKTKINNKNLQISISPNLSKIATLSTILQLREL